MTDFQMLGELLGHCPKVSNFIRLSNWRRASYAVPDPGADLQAGGRAGKLSR
jgi:hypothetical protein